MAFKQWHMEHGDDPSAIDALFEEHASYQTNEDPKPRHEEKTAKSVSSIAQQMAKMVCQVCFVP